MRDVGQLQLYRAQLASTERLILGPRLRDQYVGHSVLTTEGKTLKGLNEKPPKPLKATACVMSAHIPQVKIVTRSSPKSMGYARGLCLQAAYQEQGENK